jgi:sulfite reductase beta subunit-like hemoprotein
VAVARPKPDGTVEPGFRVFIAGGLGANPHPAQALEEFTPREELLPTIEAVLRTFDHFGNRDNKLRARLKWVVDEIGIDELRRRVVRERLLLLASSSWPGGIPSIVEELGDAPAGLGVGAEPTPVGTPVTMRVSAKADPYTRWESTNVVVGVAKGTVSAIAYARLGDITSDQFRALAAIVRDFGIDVRVTNRQNLAFRGLSAEQLPDLYERLEEIGMAEAGAELARDVVACPGADTCNLAVTQSRGLAEDIGRALEEAGLADVGGIRINISGCTNSCGQHHVADIGFNGAERRAHGRPAPGYQLLLGGHVGNTEIVFGSRALRLPAKAAAEATVRLVGRFADERTAGEPFADWLARSGGAKGMAADLKDLDEWPDPEERPDYYVDFGETGPYVADVGEGECAAG